MDGLRKRTDGKSSERDPLKDPLLIPPKEEVGKCEYGNAIVPEWSLDIFNQFLIKWAKWFAAIITKSWSWISNMILCSCAHQRGFGKNCFTLDLTIVQEERLHVLQKRLEVPFNGTHPDHQEALKSLWYLAFPDIDLDGLITDQWKEMGWQGNDPSTDFRGGGFISLENLIFFAKQFPKTFQELLWKKEGRRATWEYPFAVAGINVTFMLIHMLELRSAKPTSSCGRHFLQILADEETAFDLLYCVAFKLMDTIWVDMHASYMEFNAVIKRTRAQIEQELTMESVIRIEDMPSYSLLS